jgi:hypothetical protein
MLCRGPIRLEEAAGAQSAGKIEDVSGGLRRFSQLGRIGKSQVQGHDLRVNDIATVERPGDCRQAWNFFVASNGQAVALTQIEIQVRQSTWAPSSGATWVMAIFQERRGAYE